MEGGRPSAVRLRPLRPPLARPPGPGDALSYDATAKELLVCRVTAPPPSLPPSSLPAAGGGSGDGGGRASLLPSPRPTADPPAASAPPQTAVTVEAYALEAGAADAPLRAAPAGAGPPAAWAASTSAAGGGRPWVLALGRARSATQVLAAGPPPSSAASPRMFVHAPADRRARVLGGFWVPGGGGGGGGAPPPPPRLALVTSAGLDVAALTPRCDGTAPPAPGSAPSSSSSSLGSTPVTWWAWNPAARLCVVGTGGGEGAWAVAHSFAGDGAAVARLPPAALAGEGGAAVLHVGDGQPPLLVVAAGPAGPAALVRCGRSGLRRVGGLPAPPGAGAAPLLVACVDGLLLRLAPGCGVCVLAEVGGGGAVATPLECLPDGWRDAGAATRFTLAADGVLLDTATGAAWAVEVDGAWAAEALSTAAASTTSPAVGAAAFFARRPGGGDAAAGRTAAAVREALHSPATTAADVRALATALASTGLAVHRPAGALAPHAVVELLSAEAGGGRSSTPPMRLAAAAAAYAAALHAAGRWSELSEEAAASLHALAAGPPDLVVGRPSPLAAAATAARVLPPPPPAARVSAALAAGAPLRALRAAGPGLDRGTAGAIAAVAVERVAAADPATLAAAQLAAESVHAAAGEVVWREGE